MYTTDVKRESGMHTTKGKGPVCKGCIPRSSNDVTFWKRHTSGKGEQILY